jgi:WD40 repeat protein
VVSSERWQRIEVLFERASELAPDEHTAYLAAECGDDAALALEVRSLLASAERADGALRETIAAGVESLSHSAAASAIGSRLGPYRLESVIGEGGMGTVYLAARDDGLYDGNVAVKILRHELASPQVVARFRDERQILASLVHPAIVRLIDGGNTEDGLPYLVMEHVEGVPFAAYVRDLPPRARVALVVRVAAAVQYAHQKLIVHRDLKPSNILVDASGAPKLLDFGIAKLLAPTTEPRAAHTITGMPLLTPEYASPEQARGEPVTVASDVYSLGAVLYQTLVGEPPQRAGASLLETIRNVCDLDPRLPSAAAPPAIRSQLAGDLDGIVLKALHKQPERRYASIAAFVDDLERYLAGLPVSARDATLVYRTRKLIARHRGKLALATAIAGALTAATVVSFGQARRADAQATRAERQNLALLRERGLQELAGGHAGRALPLLVDALRADPSSAGVRFSIAEALRPFRRVYAVLDAREGVTGVEVAADGRKLAVLGDTGLVRVFDVATGAPIAQVRVGAGQIRHAAFTADGAKLVAAIGNDIAVVNLATRSLERLLRGRQCYISTVIVSGARVVAPDCDAILVWDLASGALVRSIAVEPTAPGSLLAIAVSPDGSLFAAGAGDGSIQIFDAVTGAEHARLVGHTGRVPSLVFTHDGRLVSRGDSTARVWDVARATQLAIVAGHGGMVGELAVSPDEHRAATSATDGSVWIWELATGKIVNRVTGHAFLGATARFSPDGQRVITSGDDLSYRVWNAESGALELALEGEIAGGTGPAAFGFATGAGFIGDGSIAWTGSGARVKLWHIDRAPILDDVPAHGVAVALSPDQRQLAIGNHDGVSIWNLATHERVRTFGPPNAWDVNWIGSHISVAAEQGKAAVYAPDGALVRELVGHSQTVQHAALSLDGAQAFTAANDGTARIWDVASGRELARVDHPDHVMASAWSDDGARIATACWDGKVRIWNAASRKLERVIDESPTNLLGVSFSHDSRHVLATGHAGEIDLWDIATGAHERSLIGHAAPVPTAVWSPDDQLIASSSSDNTLRIWDAHTGAQLAARYQAGELMQVVWSRDGTRVVTVSATGVARVWDVQRDDRPVAAIAVEAAMRTPFRVADGQLVLAR